MRLSDIMGRLDLAFWPQAALVIFLGVFIAVVIRLYSRTRCADFDAAALIPLQDDVVTPRASAAASPAPSTPTKGV